MDTCSDHEPENFKLEGTEDPLTQVAVRESLFTILQLKQLVSREALPIPGTYSSHKLEAVETERRKNNSYIQTRYYSSSGVSFVVQSLSLVSL